MSSGTGSTDRRHTRPDNLGGAPPAESEQLPCPRCHSTNTKFCYYNNYNLSQPRYFCKSCRRYWTQGGTLRNIPVGGGSRKNAKRSRTIPVSEEAKPTIVAVPTGSSKPDLSGPFNVTGSFTSLLNSQCQGTWALGHHEFGLGSEEIGFGFGHGRGAAWPWMEFGEGSCGGTWQVGSCVDGSFVDGADCFAWPELAISAPSQELHGGAVEVVEKL